MGGKKTINSSRLTVTAFLYMLENITEFQNVLLLSSLQDG